MLEELQQGARAGQFHLFSVRVTAAGCHVGCVGTHWILSTDIQNETKLDVNTVREIFVASREH